MKMCLKQRLFFLIVLFGAISSCVVQTKIKSKPQKKGYDFVSAKNFEYNVETFTNSNKKSSYDLSIQDKNEKFFHDSMSSFQDSLIKIGDGEKKNIWVIDSLGEEVGVLIMTGMFASTGCNINDVVMVYNPKCNIFFSIRMTDAKIMLPKKVFFQESGCTGEIYVSATSCDDCYSGYNIGFKIENSWFKIKGGEKRVTKSVLSAMQKGFSQKCSYHSGNTYVFPVIKLEECSLNFKPPLFYSWR